MGPDPDHYVHRRFGGVGEDSIDAAVATGYGWDIGSWLGLDPQGGHHPRDHRPPALHPYRHGPNSSAVGKLVYRLRTVWAGDMTARWETTCRIMPAVRLRSLARVLPAGCVGHRPWRSLPDSGWQRLWSLMTAVGDVRA